MEKNIYQEAIADAKAVRASAMANAKAAIVEAFEPKLKEMVKKSMEEAEEEMDEAYDMENEMEESYDMEEETISEEDMEEEVNHLDEEALDEILAELDGLEEQDEIEEAKEEMDEAYDMEDEMEEAKEEMDEAEEEEESEEDENEEESEEDTKVVDITLGDLVDAIKAAMAGEQTTAPEAEMDTEESTEDEISLDEILAELEEADEEEMDEAKKSDHKDELEEAKKTIAALQTELNEINLLNAKLLYMNKIFKSKSLTESQKVKVLNAFDRATTVKEVKNTYNTLNEALSIKKTSLKESVGFASKPAGMSPKTNTVEADPFVTRMQLLAGIK